MLVRNPPFDFGVKLLLNMLVPHPPLDVSVKLAQGSPEDQSLFWV